MTLGGNLSVKSQERLLLSNNDRILHAMIPTKIAEMGERDIVEIQISTIQPHLIRDFPAPYGENLGTVGKVYLILLPLV